MSTKSAIDKVRILLDQKADLFHRDFTTTSSGAADGTTLISTSVSAISSNFLVGKQATIFTTSNLNNLGQRRIISQASSGTLTVSEPFPGSVGSGVDFYISDELFIEDGDILVWLNDGQYDMLRWLNDSALFDQFRVQANLSISAGVAQLPTDFHRSIRPEFVEIDSVVAPVMDAGQLHRFLNDTTIDTKAIWSNGNIFYRPTTASTVSFKYIQRPLTISSSQNPGFSDEYEDIIVDYAVYRGWKARQNINMAGIYENRYSNKIKVINTQFAGRMI